MRWLRVVVAAGAVGLVVWAMLAWVVDRAGAAPRNMYRVGAQEVVVVLGARVDADGGPSATLRARVEHAVKVLGRSPRGTVMLFSGGVGRFGASEASVARDLAVQLGVPTERCLLEEESHSTVQNVAFSLEVLRRRFPRGVHVIVVSDPYHLLRARLLFERLGMRAVSTNPALEAPRHRSWPSRVYWALREVPAIAKDLVKMRLR